MLTTAVYTLNYCDFLPSWPPERIEFSLSQAERDIEREGESKYESERRRQSRKCTKKWKSLPSGPGSLVPLPSFYLMSLWRITLFARNSEEGDILSARWSQSTLYDRRAGCWQPLLSKWGKNKVGWLSSRALMAGLKPCSQTLVGCSCTLPIIELKALLNISFVLWELDSSEHSKS